MACILDCFNKCLRKVISDLLELPELKVIIIVVFICMYVCMCSQHFLSLGAQGDVGGIGGVGATGAQGDN